MMKYMLDTNICIYTIKKKPPMVLRRFMSHNSEELRISSPTYAELVHGVEKSQAVDRNSLALALFLSPITILSFDDRAAEGLEYGINSSVQPCDCHFTYIAKSIISHPVFPSVEPHFWHCAAVHPPKRHNAFWLY